MSQEAQYIIFDCAWPFHCANKDHDHTPAKAFKIANLSASESQAACQKCGYLLEKNSAVAGNRCPDCGMRLTIFSEPKQ